MDLRLIRNATLRLTYAGVELLVDPMLGVVGSIRPMAGVQKRNPTVELPCSIGEVLDGVEGVLVSHLHPDHLDDAALGLLPRHLPVLGAPSTHAGLVESGFEDVVELAAPIRWRGLTITPTIGHHGSGDVLARMGEVIGVVLAADGEPTIYWAGDTILYPPVLEAIDSVRPDVIVTHSGGAAAGGVNIIMDAADTLDVARAAPWATVIAVHFEAIAHCFATRAELRAAADDAGVSAKRLLIPADGETISV